MAEPKQEEPPFESTPRQGTAPGLDFLLDQGLMALLFRPDSLGGHPLHARDTADLLPLRERILGLVAALFTARDTNSSESPPSPARSGAKEGNSPPRQVEVRRAAEAIPPGPLDPRLLEFLAGVKPLLPPRKAKEVAPPWAESQPPSGTDTRSEAQDGSADEGGGEAPSAPAE